MKRVWLAIVGLSFLAPQLVHAAAESSSRKQTRTWGDLSFRPSTRVPKNAPYPMRSQTYRDSAYDRLLHHYTRLSVSPMPFAQHATLEAALAADRPGIETWVKQTLHPDGLRHKIARGLAWWETRREYEVRRDIASSVEARKWLYDDQAESLRLIDHELSQLPESLTGGLHIGHPWGNPLLADWHQVKGEVEAVLRTMPRPADPPPRPYFAPGPRFTRVEREVPTLLDRLGTHVLEAIDPEFRYELRRARIANPRAWF